MSVSIPGTIYLVCLDRPVTEGRPARHYLGWTRDLDSRIAEHQSGNGARLLSVALSRGISFRVVRTWRGDRHLERRLKKIHGARLCPDCGKAIHDRRMAQQRRRREMKRTGDSLEAVILNEVGREMGIDPGPLRIQARREIEVYERSRRP